MDTLLESRYAFPGQPARWLAHHAPANTSRHHSSLARVLRHSGAEGGGPPCASAPGRRNAVKIARKRRASSPKFFASRQVAQPQPKLQRDVMSAGGGILRCFIHSMLILWFFLSAGISSRLGIKICRPASGVILVYPCTS